MKGDLPQRTKDYALRIIRLYLALPKSDVGKVMGMQVLRSGISVGAQIREGSRPKSARDFISKMEGALQELEETAYWLELIAESKLMKAQLLSSLLKETNELNAILTTMVRRTKASL